MVAWGLYVEDFLERSSLSVEEFRSTFTGSWMFGYAAALRNVGVETAIFCVSKSVAEVTWTVHAATGIRMCLMPPPRAYRRARTWMRSGYGRTVAQSFELPRVLYLLLYPLLFIVKEVAPFTSTPATKLARELRRHGFEVILCQEYEFPRFDVCVLLGRLLHIPTFAIFQGGDYQRWLVERLTRRLSMRLCTGLLIGAGGEVTRVLRTYAVPEHKIARIPNPLDVGTWRPRDHQAARARLGIPLDAAVAAWHGRVEIWKKGLDVLVEAWVDLCAQRPAGHLRLVLIGDGDGADDLRARLASGGLDNVVWIDRLLSDPAEIASLLAAADVYAFPSRHEGFPLAPLEAMACGLPVVATDVSGIRDILPSGDARAGLIVPPETPLALSEALGALLDDRELRRKLGEQARRRALDFSAERVGRDAREVLFG